MPLLRVPQVQVELALRRSVLPTTLSFGLASTSFRAFVAAAFSAASRCSASSRACTRWPGKPSRMGPVIWVRTPARPRAPAGAGSVTVCVSRRWHGGGARGVVVVCVGGGGEGHLFLGPVLRDLGGELGVFLLLLLLELPQRLLGLSSRCGLPSSSAAAIALLVHGWPSACQRWYHQRSRGRRPARRVTRVSIRASATTPRPAREHVRPIRPADTHPPPPPPSRPASCRPPAHAARVWRQGGG